MHKKYTVVFSNLLLKLSQIMSKLSKKDMDDLYEGRAELILSIKRKEEKSKENILGNIDLGKIAQDISIMSSREDAVVYLKKHNFTKAKLILLAKYLDITVIRTDKNEQLIEKIIEATIGYRLRSEAIQKV